MTAPDGTDGFSVVASAYAEALADKVNVSPGIRLLIVYDMPRVNEVKDVKRLQTSRDSD